MNKKERLMRAKDYVLYYGRNKIDELAKFDLAIIEPTGYTVNNVIELKATDTLVLAYLSIMEINPSMSDFKLLKEEDFIAKNGHPLMNETFGNYVVDLRSKRWKDLLYYKSGKLLINDGYDGLFLDTIGDCEDNSLSDDEKTTQIIAATDFVRNIKNNFEGCLLVQNNGLEKLCTYTAQYIDGICWENPPFNRSESILWTQEIINRMEILQKKENVRVLILVEEKEQNVNKRKLLDNLIITKRISMDKGFISYIAPHDYMSGINHGF